MMKDSFDPYHVWLGIPPAEQPPNLYRLLGIQVFEENPDVIEAAADQRMGHLRTYQSGKRSRLSQELLNKVAAAKICLLNSSRRTEYDQELRQKQEAKRADNEAPTPLSENTAPAKPVPIAKAMAVQVDPGVDRMLDTTSQGPSDLRLRMAARRKQTKLGGIIAVTVVGVLLVAVLVMWKLRPTEGTMVFHWPSGNRQGISVKVDGQPVPIPSGETFEHKCSPGRHKVVVCRPKCEPFTQTVTVDAGQSVAINPLWQRFSTAVPDTPVETARDVVEDVRSSVTSSTIELGADSGGQPEQVAVSKKPSAPKRRRPVKRRPAIAELVQKEPEGEATHKPDDESNRPSAVTLADLFEDENFGGDTIGQEGPSDRHTDRSSMEPGGKQDTPSEKKQRLPVPSNAAQEEIAAKLDEAFGLGDSATPAEKLALAEKLLAMNQKFEGKPNERFVLLRKTVKLASEGGDASLMVRTVDVMGSYFSINALAAKSKVLGEFSAGATSSQEIGSLVRSSRGVIAQALEEKRYDIAMEVADSAYQPCRRPQGHGFRKETLERREHVQKTYREVQELQQARDALEANAEDGDANLVLGRWYCYSQSNWKQGIVHLAKCSDEELRELASWELGRPPSTPDDQIELADAWWKLADSREGEERVALLLRAGCWYKQAQAKMEFGLDKVKVENRLKEIARAGQPIANSPDYQPKAEVPTSRGIWVDVP